MRDRWATFDCYGTLVDWERGIRSAFRELWPDADDAALLERYHEVEPAVERDAPGASYREVLARSLAGVADASRLEVPPGHAAALAESLPSWPAFEEVPAALRELRERGWRLAILSNTDPDLLASSIATLGVDIDVRVTARDAGGYKPAHGHWIRFFEATGADRDGHVHVAASLFHDIAPCAELGLRAVWIDRRGETSGLPRAAELPDLTGLPATLDALVPADATD